jgi:hypothetical protein
MPLLDPALTSAIDGTHIEYMKTLLESHPKTSRIFNKSTAALGTIVKQTGKGMKNLARHAYLIKKANFDPFEGGKAEGEPDSNFDKGSIEEGMKVEREHTVHKSVQKRIAKDHLKEDPKYYLKLKKMEAKK